MVSRNHIVKIAHAPLVLTVVKVTQQSELLLRAVVSNARLRKYCLTRSRQTMHSCWQAAALVFSKKMVS